MSRIIVTDSYELERDLREKRVLTFSHPALEEVQGLFNLIP